MGPGTRPKGFSDACSTLRRPSQKAGSWSRCGHWPWHQLHHATEGHCPWAAGMAAEKPNRGVCLSDTCLRHWQGPSGEPSWLCAACLRWSGPVECSRHGRMQTTLSSVTSQRLYDLRDTAPLSSPYKWGQRLNSGSLSPNP